MEKRYVSAKTSYLHLEGSGQGPSRWVLIFGDEVEATDELDAAGKQRKVFFRGRAGWISDEQLTDTACLEMYFIDVGQGDSAFVVTPGRKTILIDGGINHRALGFLAWKYRLDEPENSIEIDLMVLTHADSDHIRGLTPIIAHPQIRVKRIIHSGIATYESGCDTPLGDVDQSKRFLLSRHSALPDLGTATLSDDFAAWRRAIEAEGAPPRYEAVDTETPPLQIGDNRISLEVLGPLLERRSGTFCFPWLHDEAHTINGHSVVLRLQYGKVTALFAGDLNIKGAQRLLADPARKARFGAHVFKAPHHGSHEFHRPLLDAVRPQISVISSGDDGDHGHPRAVFLGACGQASRSPRPLLFSTEIASTFREIGEPPAGSGGVRLEDPAFASLGLSALARLLFKRRLHGMINVRTDGEHLYAARRVPASYWWEAEGPLDPAA